MKILREGRYRWMEEISVQNIVIGSGAAGLAAALRLAQGGQAGNVIVTENLNAGTSRNTGSDKQTYYKLSLAAGDPDSVRDMAEDLFDGQCVDGDQALCEAALSVRGFMSLVDLGVPFPCTEYGEYMGYKTDHDRGRRATSAGPYTSRMMTEALETAVRQRQIPIYDHTRALKLLVKDNRVHGVLCLKQHASGASFVIFWAANIVLATGGPAAMYLDSVYPQSQLPDRERIAENIAETLETMDSSTPVQEGRPVHFPGEHMAQVRKENMELGVPVEESIWQQVLDM